MLKVATFPLFSGRHSNKNNTTSKKVVFMFYLMLRMTLSRSAS